MFYRKMVLYGTVLLLIEITIYNLLNFLHNDYIVLSWFFIVHLLVGLFVNKIYLNYIKKVISKAKLNSLQNDVSNTTGIGKVKGGISVGRIILGIIIAFGIFLIPVFLFILMFGGMAK